MINENLSTAEPEAPYDLPCPWTGENNAFRIEISDGAYHGYAKDGSFIHAADKAGLDREIEIITAVHKRCRELRDEHGSYTEAHTQYRNQVKPMLDATRQAHETLAGLRTQHKVAEAGAIVAQVTSEPKPTQEMLDLQAQIAQHEQLLFENNIENKEPLYGRILSELGGYAKVENE